MAKRIERLQRPWVKERKPFERENSNSEFYNSRKWRNARKGFLMLNPLCVKCKENDVITIATVVDHIIPINKGGAKLDTLNFQSLCASCHNSKSARESARG